MQDLHHWVRALALDTKRVSVHLLTEFPQCVIYVCSMQSESCDVSKQSLWTP